MYLERLIITNYRSCKNVQIGFDANEPNVLIGINDCGKTTILKALELLFNDKSAFNFIKDNSVKNDISNTTLSIEEFNQILSDCELPELPYNARQTYIFGKLKIANGELTPEIIETLSTTLKWSLECRENEYLWVAKSFDGNANVSKSFLLLDDTIRNEVPIKAFSLTQVQLNSLIRELNIPAEFIQNDNQAGPVSNFEKVRGIYRSQVSSPKWHEFKFERNDKNVLPTFRYLDWNFSLDEIKNLAGDAMNGIIQQHLNPLKEQARNTANEVNNGINQELERIQNMIGTDFPNITAIKANIYIDIKESITDILINKTNADGDIHLDAQGEGVKRQIWFAMIKAAAIRAREYNEIANQFIWAFDEPETHLYPTAQRQLFDIIKNISTTNVQTILSTHSTIFIDKTKLESIRGVMQVDTGYTELYGIDNVDEIFKNLQIRNSDFLFYNKFLIIEGDTEAYLIPKLYKLWRNKTPEEDSIQIINIKGKDKWVQTKSILENIFINFRKNINNLVFLFDNDASYKIGQQSITDNMFFVGIQDIEDSIPSDVWANICNAKIAEWNITVTVEEIEEIKHSVPNDRVATNNEKFYLKLQKLLKQKVGSVINRQINYNILPDKGSDSGEMILPFITNREMINERVIASFNKLMPNGR